MKEFMKKKTCTGKLSMQNFWEIPWYFVIFQKSADTVRRQLGDLTQKINWCSYQPCVHKSKDQEKNCKILRKWQNKLYVISVEKIRYKTKFIRFTSKLQCRLFKRLCMLINSLILCRVTKWMFKFVALQRLCNLWLKTQRDFLWIM